MGQQYSQTIQFCCTACSVCSCCSYCSRYDYNQLDKLNLITNNEEIDNYQSNGIYNQSLKESKKHNQEKTKFRAFIIAYNKHYGYLLLRTYKKNKGIHYQLPGGHIDKHELHGRNVIEAGKIAAKRELFEETGLLINNISQLKYLNFGIKNRVYFQLLIKNQDSLHFNNDINILNILTLSLNDKQKFYLKLSNEHNGFQFEKNILKCIEMIKLHSGGYNSKALSLYAKKAKHEKKLKKKKDITH